MRSQLRRLATNNSGIFYKCCLDVLLETVEKETERNRLKSLAELLGELTEIVENKSFSQK